MAAVSSLFLGLACSECQRFPPAGEANPGVPSQTVGHYEPSVLSVKAGECVNIHCTFLDQSDRMIWYKQRFGEMPQKVGESLTHNEINISPEFNKSGLKMKKTETDFFLTFLHINKEDEGLYFCGIFSWVRNSFSNGTFISVTDDQEFSVLVVQSDVMDSVPAGESLNLQCFVFSKSRSVELPVLWFRSASPESRPQIVYSHYNSSHQCKESSNTYTCVYNFSKNILTINDTGTYYCAVAMCGKIIFGNGTTVQLESVDSLWMFLAVALVVCMIVISVQAILICKFRSCKPCRDRFLSSGGEAQLVRCPSDSLNYAHMSSVTLFVLHRLVPLQRQQSAADRFLSSGGEAQMLRCPSDSLNAHVSSVFLNADWLLPRNSGSRLGT
ncbi:uncharacterized protein LOC134318692 [Trichomycterus rosablanca]|uniref:uncharacterized protein LOC134318692 n=1 Tax=Trichomycterus rosablanca TaxID=2290929 RepID=UPI002F35F02A